jgi:outer membrane protein assembly factor BamA
MLTKLERAPVLAGSLVVLAVFAISVMARHHVVRRHPHHYTIDVTGNHAIPTAELRAAVVDALGGDTAPPFDPAVLERANLMLTVFYYDRGYPYVRVDPLRVDRAHHTITLSIATEGRRFTMSDVRVEGELIGDAAANLAGLGTRPGTVFSRATVMADLEALKTSYKAAGYPHAEVMPLTQIDVEHATIALVFQITRGAP